MTMQEKVHAVLVPTLFVVSLLWLRYENTKKEKKP